MITFKTLLCEDDGDKYSADIDKLVGILDTALNNQKWMKHTHFAFKENAKEIRDYVKANIEPYNYRSNVKEELIKRCIKVLQDVSKVLHLPTTYTPTDKPYYTVKALANWHEIKMEIEGILKLNLDKTDLDLHSELILKDSV